MEEASRALSTLREQHDKEVTKLKECIAEDLLMTVELEPESVEQIKALRNQLGLPAATVDSAGEFLSALQETRSVLQRASAIFGRVPADQRTRFLVGSTLVVFLPPVVAILVGAAAGLLSPYAATMASFAGWLSTTLATGTGWLRDRTRTLNEQIAKVEKLQAHVRQRVEAAAKTIGWAAVKLSPRARTAPLFALLHLYRRFITIGTLVKMIAEFLEDRRGSGQPFRTFLDDF